MSGLDSQNQRTVLPRTRPDFDVAIRRDTPPIKKRVKEQETLTIDGWPDLATVIENSGCRARRPSRPVDLQRFQQRRLADVVLARDQIYPTQPLNAKVSKCAKV